MGIPSFSIVVIIADSGVLSVVAAAVFLPIGNDFVSVLEIAFLSIADIFFCLTGNSLFSAVIFVFVNSAVLSAGSFIISQIRIQQIKPARINIPRLPSFLRRLTLRSFFLRTLGITCP